MRWRSARKEARSWADWRADLWLDLRRSHERAENHAWFPPGHPARHEGLPRDYRRIRPRTVRGFVRAGVAEGQLYIAAAGAASAEALLPLLEQHFGGMSGTTRQAPLPPVSPAPATWLVGRSGFSVAEISLMMPGPGLGDPEMAAAEVLMGVLAGDYTSRIQGDLRETRGLTYGVEGEVDAWEGGGRLIIRAEVEEERAAEALLAMESHIDEVLRAGLTPEEIHRAAQALLLDAGWIGATNQGVTGLLTELWMRGETLTEHQARLKAISEMSPARIAASSGWLNPDTRVWVITGDPRALEKTLKAAGRPPTLVITARELSEER